MKYLATAVLVSLAVTSVSFASGAVQRPPEPEPNFDVRLPGSVLADGFVLRAPDADRRALAGEFLRRHPGAALRWDGMSGAPRWWAAEPGRALSAPAAGRPEAVVRQFLDARAIWIGLATAELRDLGVSSVVPAPDGGARVHFLQRAHGLEVFGARMLVTVGGDGSVRSLGGSVYAGVERPGEPTIEAAQAVRYAVENVYPDLPFVGSAQIVLDERERCIEFSEEPAFARPPRARLVLFPERDGARLAWEVRIAEHGFLTDYTILIDAGTGDLLFRRNATLYADARVLLGGHPTPQGEEFAPEPYTLVTIPDSTPESPQGWISGAGTSLDGNNAISHLDFPGLPGLSEVSSIYDYSFGTQESSLVTAWYWVNDAHDRFYAAGFDEAAGNFQQDNFGRGGLGGDPMGVVAWSTGSRDNAFYIPAPDGEAVSVNMLWMSCEFCGDHDSYPENGGERPGAFDRSVLVHEYAHGVSTRMVGGPAEVSCLYGTQSGALGEGWSDLFAASFHDEPHDGDYFLEGLGWVRGLRHDRQYQHMCEDGGCTVHGDGMIWGGALWDLRNSMTALDPANGIRDFERIIVEGMAETPCFPTMLDARDGILQADTLLFGSSHHQLIWNAFAARGMGEAASSTGEDDVAPVADFTVPSGLECTPPSTPSGLTAAAEGDNAIRLDYSTTGAAAVEIWRDDLDNIIDRPRMIAYSASATTHLDTTVQGGKTYRYHLAALGTGGVNCSSTDSATADATATGPCSEYPRFVPNLSITDGSPDCRLSLSWDAAQVGCPGSADPIVYNVYRANGAGFEPSERLMIGRTSATTVQDIPPQDGQTYYYLVLAQHGTTGDAADHARRGGAQVMQWMPRLARLGRTTVEFWDFETGAQGWTTDNSSDPAGGWTLVVPTPTYYEDTLFAPDEAAGGSGLSWVTGDSGTPQSFIEQDLDGFNNRLISPIWNGSGGGTILSFDYWSSTSGGALLDGIEILVRSFGQFAYVTPVRLMGTQLFEAPGRHGWQRAEIDLADYVTPTQQMQIEFIPKPAWLSEFGIDNVRVESGASCARSALAIQSVEVEDSVPGWGNDNGLLEPGETAHLRVTLVNNGGATATTPSGVLLGGPTNLIVHEADATFPSILPAGTGSTQGDGFTVSLAHGSECGDTVFLDLEVVDADGVIARDTWFPETGEFFTDVVFADDFETDTGWLVDGAGPGEGVWQRGDPVGTTNGTDQANPENDSPYDAGTRCYVTENGAPGGDPNLTDVDIDFPILYSPALDLSGYKRARALFDLWFYEDAASSEDYVTYGAGVDRDGSPRASAVAYEFSGDGGWEARQLDLTPVVPMAPGVRVMMAAQDQDESVSPGFLDNVVEVGLDNVVVEADRAVCDLSSVMPPNGIGESLRVDRSATIDLTWIAAVPDASHDPPAYYRVYVSSAPSGGFAVTATPMATADSRTTEGGSEYYLVTSVNASGDSGDAPVP
jgi:hypothetical protein